MQHMADYAYFLRIERRLSPNTVSAYVRDVDSFLGTGVDPCLAVPDDVIGYLSARSRDLSERSQARMLSSLRSFFDWMVMEGERSDNPCDGVDAPKIGRHLPDILSVEEVDAIISSLDGHDARSVRDRAILEVLYGCGLRVSELCGLRLSHIYFDKGFVRVVGKGDKERLVPLGEIAADAIRSYLELRPTPGDPSSDDIVFLNRSGRALSRVSVFKMIKEQAMLAGVRKEISPHTFRHSFATHLIENGADLRVVQEMLGHESILTTEIYTHVDARTWQSSVLEHHPRR